MITLDQDERMGLPSASKMESYFLCPGKYLAEKDLPEEARGEDAARGDRVHAALASGDLAGLHDDGELDLSRSCAGQLAELASQWSGGQDYQHFREERLWLFDDALNHLCSGKYDYTAVQGDRALVVDYKSGWSDTTHSARNEQLRTLAVLAAENFCVDEVTVAIIQPKVSPRPDICLYERRDLVQSRERLVGQLDYISKPGAPRIPGKKQCGDCKAKTTCYAATDQVTVLAHYEPKQVVDPEELAKWLDAWDVAEKVGQALERKALQLALTGVQIPGRKIKENAPKRSIKDATVAFSKLQDRIDAATFAACCTVKISELETAFRKATGLKVKDAKDVFNELLADTIELKQAAPSLVREEGGE